MYVYHYGSISVDVIFDIEGHVLGLSSPCVSWQSYVYPDSTGHSFLYQLQFLFEICGYKEFHLKV
jgi:hypothetical protein